MPPSLIADNTFLMTERGPALVAALERDVDRVWTVNRNGALVLSPVMKVTPGSDIPAWRLLTEAGDVVVPSGMLALTSDGPLDGAEVEAALRRDDPIRLDIVSPEDLPSPQRSKAPTREVYRCCLAALPANVIQLPQGNGIGDELVHRLVKLIEKADVSYALIEDDRWTALVLEPVKDAGNASRAEWELQADVMAMLTAWSAHSDGYESRVRLADEGLRCHLLASLAGAGRQFSVKWVPGYAPVEARVRVAPDRPWPARVAVQDVHPLQASTQMVETAEAGDLIVSLAVLRPR